MQRRSLQVWTSRKMYTLYLRFRIYMNAETRLSFTNVVFEDKSFFFFLYLSFLTNTADYTMKCNMNNIQTPLHGRGSRYILFLWLRHVACSSLAWVIGGAVRNSKELQVATTMAVERNVRFLWPIMARSSDEYQIDLTFFFLLRFYVTSYLSSFFFFMSWFFKIFNT